MSKNVKIFLGVVAAVVAATVGWLFFKPVPEASKPVAKQEKLAKRAKRIADAKATRAKARAERPKREKSKRKVAAEVAAASRTSMSEPEQKIYDSIQDAWDDENFDDLRALVDEAAKSANPELRLQAVEALDWFGKDALPELTLFMADADDDVRDAACDAWRSGVSQIENDNLRGDAVLAAMQVVRNTDQLELMIMEVTDLSDSEQIRIVESLIGGDNKSADAVAREHYEFVTGEEYEGAEAAQKWLRENSDDEEAE